MAEITVLSPGMGEGVGSQRPGAPSHTFPGPSGRARPCFQEEGASGSVRGADSFWGLRKSKGPAFLSKVETEAEGAQVHGTRLSTGTFWNGTQDPVQNHL